MPVKYFTRNNRDFLINFYQHLPKPKNKTFHILPNRSFRPPPPRTKTGDERTRTANPRVANAVLSQLSYVPEIDSRSNGISATNEHR